jgi:hypothetical protein
MYLENFDSQDICCVTFSACCFIKGSWFGQISFHPVCTFFVSLLECSGSVAKCLEDQSPIDTSLAIREDCPNGGAVAASLSCEHAQRVILSCGADNPSIVEFLHLVFCRHLQ